jgi:hypothetical protein
MLALLITTCLLRSSLAWASTGLEQVYIVKLATEDVLASRSVDHHLLFHQNAAGAGLEYSVRHSFNSPGIFTGTSVHVRSDGTPAEIRARLEAIPGVAYAVPAARAYIPEPNLGNSSLGENTPMSLYNAELEPMKLNKPITPGADGNLASALQMGGIDKLHALGIKGKGVKIGIIDTGVDYRNPALGAGFGPGHKIAGGYSWIPEGSDPLATCYGGGHGTHVAGMAPTLLS